MTAEGMVVYAGSVGRAVVTPSIHAYGLTLRANLVASGVFREETGQLILTTDYEFSSPSTAAMVLMGRNANGRREWRTSGGVTLAQVQESALT